MRILILLIATFLASNLCAQVTEGTTVTATVNNIQKTKGKVHFALYTEGNFMKKPVSALASSIENGKATVSFENIPEGDYAILCFHDENNNEQMDFQANGMPMEKYGASNNVMSFGPPLWNDASFSVKDEPISLEIKL